MAPRAATDQTVVPPAHLPPDVAAVWTEVVTRNAMHAGSPHELEAYCTLVATLRRHQRRVAEEGDYPEDAKGQPVPHPSLEIIRRTAADLRAWGRRFA